MNTVNGYTIKSELGAGAFGKVYLVKKDNRYYAMKMTQISRLNEREKEFAIKECKVLQSLNHNHITKLYDKFLYKGCLCMVMEYANKGDLGKHIINRGENLFSEEEILYIFVQIVLALKYIHDRNIIHRDIKPQNIFISSDNYVKIGDFNVCKQLQPHQANTSTMTGTLNYLSPEILSGQGYNTQTDIFSLGCVLYELCSLRKAFVCISPEDYLKKIIGRNYRAIPDRYSNDMRYLINRMLDPNPHTRITANQILELNFINCLLRPNPTNMPANANGTIDHNAQPPPPEYEGDIVTDVFATIGVISTLVWLGKKIFGK
ncbi:hypothetical protein M9Y10_026686 [Tritrichomonas musculus]|uniref:non-specific serine/threonine protein kinase n=1 Tax=Tritrichomonas musculus TaxID=1915356 RepID=A0ABR2H690_9EUKA